MAEAHSNCTQFGMVRKILMATDVLPIARATCEVSETPAAPGGLRVGTGSFMGGTAEGLRAVSRFNPVPHTTRPFSFIYSLQTHVLYGGVDC